MRFEQLPQSEHPRYELRLIRASDLESMYRYLSSAAVVDLAGEGPSSVDELASCVWQEGIASDLLPLRLAIADRASGELAGTAGFHSISLRHRSAEIACDLAPRLWGNGIGSYMCSLHVTWAHRDLDYVRLQATALENNVLMPYLVFMELPLTASPATISR